MTIAAHPAAPQAPGRGLVSALCTSIPRNEFFAGLYILGIANGLLGRVLLAMQQGWTEILGVDISVLVWFACFAGLSTLLGGKKDNLRPMDLAVGAVFVVCVLLPIFALSWVAVTGLSFYILLFANNDSGRHRGAWILLALTVPMLWSRLLFQFFTGPILTIDAALVAYVLGTERTGNMVGFGDGSGYMALIPACSSFTNMSLALLCWVSVSQWAGHRWTAVDLLWCLLAVVSVLAINVTRIVLTGMSQAHYNIIHTPAGEMVFGFIILGVIVGISVLGVRRELFARA
jgi:hypothetical protein